MECLCSNGGLFCASLVVSGRASMSVGNLLKFCTNMFWIIYEHIYISLKGSMLQLMLDISFTGTLVRWSIRAMSHAYCPLPHTGELKVLLY